MADPGAVRAALKGFDPAPAEPMSGRYGNGGRIPWLQSTVYTTTRTESMSDRKTPRRDIPKNIAERMIETARYRYGRVQRSGDVEEMDWCKQYAEVARRYGRGVNKKRG